MRRPRSDVRSDRCRSKPCQCPRHGDERRAMATRKWSRRYQCQCPRPQSGDGIHSERQIPKMAERQAARTIESTVLGGAIGTGVVVGSVILSCTELDTELDASSDPARIRNHPYLRNWPLQVNYTRVGVLAQDAIQYTVTIVHYSLLRLCSGAHRGGPQGPLRHGGVRTLSSRKLHV